jgi:hypothetical protein
VRDDATFYDKWTGLLLDSGATIYGLRGRSRSLKNIYDKVTA